MLNTFPFYDLETWMREHGYKIDPIDLLTGSFNWNYTDMALYGRDDFEFVRYYESMAADKNYGLGYGWTTNYTYRLMITDLYARVTIPRGREIYFDRNTDGSYRSVGDYTFAIANGYYEMQDRDGTIYLFDDDRLLRSIKYKDGRVISFSYTGRNLTRVTNGMDTFVFTYNADGNMDTVTDSIGRVVNLSYDGDYLSAVENTDADSLRYTYTAAGYLETVKNFKGQLYVENDYDNIGRVIHQYAANVGTFDISYDDENRVNTCVGTDGYFAELRYDEQGFPISMTTSEGTLSITTNEKGQITSETDREGNTTRYNHDAAGNISKITYADGTTAKFVYDANRRVISYTDCNGIISTYTYNTQGRMTSAKDGRGNTISYVYDSHGNLTSYTDAEGAKTSYTYDSKGNRTSATDAKGNKTTYEYDEQGRLIAQTSADGSRTEYEYTTAGKLVKVIDADGSEKTYTVDGNGFNTSESDWMGNITAYEHNVQNQITKITDPMGNQTSHASVSYTHLTLPTIYSV